jgi:hypothetical protein
LTKIELPHKILTLKKTSTENRGRILKAVREKNKHTQVKPSKSQQVSTETLKARTAWNEVF